MTVKIEGFLENIENHHNEGHEKKTITILPGERQRAFIEIRGNRQMKRLEKVKIGDRVSVDVYIQGHCSKKSGIRYNNLFGTNVKKIENVNQAESQAM